MTLIKKSLLAAREFFAATVLLLLTIIGLIVGMIDPDDE